jgi:hypothetical protein
VGKWQIFYERLKQQRVALASAISMAGVLIVVVPAPAFPVVVGCLGALMILLVRECFREGSRPGSPPRGQG